MYTTCTGWRKKGREGDERQYNECYLSSAKLCDFFVGIELNK